MCFITGTKICLREVHREDLSLFKAWRNDAELTKNFRTVGPLTEKNQDWYFDNIVNSDNHKVFTIVKKESMETIGEIRLSYINFIDGNAEIGILLNPTQQRKKYGTEALRIIVEFGFNRLRLHRLECQYLESNIPSMKLFKSCGFIIEGIKKDAKFFDREYHNVMIASLLSTGYKAIKSIK